MFTNRQSHEKNLLLEANFCKASLQAMMNNVKTASTLPVVLLLVMPPSLDALMIVMS